MIHRLPPTMMKSRTVVKAIASRFSLGVVVKFKCRKKRRCDQDLQHRRGGDDVHDARRRQGVAVDQVEGDGRQHDGEHEAHEVGEKAVAFHHSSPGR